MSIGTRMGRPVELLLVEDNPGDVRLLQECLEESAVNVRLSVVTDGAVALDYLRRVGSFADAARPDLIFLDLNLPGRNGHDTLAEIKRDEQFRAIPIVVLSTSDSEPDIQACYKLQASCYVTKPVYFQQLLDTVREIQRFWFTIAQLPSGPGTTQDGADSG